jgi:hypothetical protein
MTFIASVVARKGVAIIADSLVTTMEKVLDYDVFADWKKTAYQFDEEGRSGLDKLKSLFRKKPVHTKNYEEKVFEYDRYTAVSIAGSPVINGIYIEQIIRESIDINKGDKNYRIKTIETKISDFCCLLNKHTIRHLNRFGNIASTVLLFTHYTKSEQQTIIYKVEIEACTRADMSDDSFSCVSFRRMPEFHKVVCAGQSSISRRILFGNKDFLQGIIPRIIYLVAEKLGIRGDDIPETFTTDFMLDVDSILTEQFYRDMKITRLTDLSLQQAVDLAFLLMQVEMNFQEYTEKIPLVGGVIKLAVIDQEGFRFMAGHEIQKPNMLN